MSHRAFDKSNGCTKTYTILFLKRCVEKHSVAGEEDYAILSKIQGSAKKPTYIKHLDSPYTSTSICQYKQDT